MRIKIVILALIVLGGGVSTLAEIGPYEIPFGTDGIYPWSQYNRAGIDSLVSVLGFNFVVDNLYYQADQDSFEKYDLGLVFGGRRRLQNPDQEKWLKYSFNTYCAIAPNWSSGLFFFRHPTLNDSLYFDGSVLVCLGGYIPTDTFYVDGVSCDPPVQLINEGLILRGNGYKSNCDGIQKTSDRKLEVRISIDSIGVETDTVCSFFVWTDQYTCYEDTISIFQGAVTAGDFGDTTYPVFINRSFSYKYTPSCNSCNPSIPLHIDVFTTGKRTVYVDTVYTYTDPDGKLLATGRLDSEIIASVDTSWGYFGQTLAFYPWGMDEPRPDQYAVLFPRLDSLIAVATGDTLRAWTFVQEDYPEFVEYVRPSILVPDKYPFWGTDEYGMTGYYGYGCDSCLQNRLNSLCDQLQSIRNVVDTASSHPELWVTLQSFSGEIWRLPSASEFRMEYGLALAYGADGLCAWLYWRDNMVGIRKPDGDTTELYGMLRDKISPWIHSIDSSYLSLNWLRTYRVCPTEATQVDQATYIDSIAYWCDTTSTSNPDAGWFQVTEFGGPLDVPGDYILIVNRACNYDSTTVTPDIWATVFLDTGHYTGNQYLITNVDTNKHEKIYTGKLNGKLSFTTVLEGGEAKLFSIESRKSSKSAK